MNSHEKSHRQNARPLSYLVCDKQLSYILRVKDVEKWLVTRSVSSRHMKAFRGKVDTNHLTVLHHNQLAAVLQVVAQEKK